MKRKYLLLVFCFFLWQGVLLAQGKNAAARPNIIIILADDLGYGDLGIYGGDVPVPNLKALAAEGLQFTDFHSNGAVCSPTRAALLTGRYQQRMGIEKALSETDAGLGDEKAKKEITIAQYLQQAGYYTGIIGKWHLGSTPGQSPLDHGFNEFWGMLHGSGDYHSKMTTSGKYDWWHNRELYPAEKYNTELITGHALDFINTHQQSPFFLYVAQNAIHFPWQAADDTAHRKKGLRYNEVSGPLNKLGQHAPSEVRGVISQMIREMDNSVGKIITRLKELNLDKNTLVLFCSDNGGIVKYEGGYNNISSNLPYRGEKGTVYEGGHRVPAIAWWPGRINKGTNASLVMTMDILPTILEIAGISKQAGSAVNKLDGISISDLLLNQQDLQPRKLFWRHRASYAVRFGNWKLVLPDEKGQPELYNLKEDAAEKNNLSATQPGLVKELMAELQKWKAEVYSNN